MLEFNEKSIKVKIDTSKCHTCSTKACVEACGKYARGILGIDEEGRASVMGKSAEEVARLGTECLACEFACEFHGNGAIKIEVPVKGLDAYLKRRGLS